MWQGITVEFDRFHQFSQLLLKDEFVLSYSGYVSEDILRAVGETLRERLNDHVSDSNQIRNVFSIFVELMQNIIRYGDDGPQPDDPSTGDKPSFGIVLVSEHQGQLSVMTGNYVTPDEAEDLTSRLTHLATKSSDELRVMYREKLRQPVEDSSKGASLGLIEIARRASLPLTFEVQDGFGGHKFFMIKATV